MLLTVWLYACLRGVLSARVVEDRCRYDATFRVGCGRRVPGHTTFSRSRRHLFAQDGLAEDLFCRVLRVCALAGPGRLTVVAGDGVKIAADAPEEASRTGAGLRKLAARVIAGARKAAADEDAARGALPGTGLLPGADTVPPRPDPRSRAGRVLACPEGPEAEREAAEAAAREQGRACLEALAAGTAAAGRPPAAVALAAQQVRLETAIAAGETTLADWQARRAAGRPAGRPPARPGTGNKAGKARARPEALQARAAAEAGQAPDAGTGKKPRRRRRRNVTGPDSRLLPVRGGGFIQGYDCQGAAAGDRLMPGGCACQDTGGVLQAQAPAAVAEKGAAAARAADPALPAKGHGRLRILPGRGKHDPGHDIAACHAAMTGGTGVLAEDAGYHSEANLTAPGPARLIADGKTSGLACREPAAGPPPADATPPEASAHRLRTPDGRAACKRRAPDAEGLHASLKDQRGLRRFSLRGLHNATSEFPFAGLAGNLQLLTAIS
jgi:hypothetical protein